MTYYLIDYENTNSGGLKGCAKLKKSDRVFIFYSENASKINLDFFAANGKPKISAIKVPVKKQSLDMHLASYIGYLIGRHKGEQCKFVIISMDNDYDNIISFWRKKKVDVVRRENFTSNVANEYDRPEYSVLEVELFKFFDNQKDAETVIHIVEKCTSKIAINNMLMQKFKNGRRVQEIYNIVKPYIDDKT